MKRSRFPVVIPDGTRMGGTDGRLWRVFVAPWWRVDRWLSWWWRGWRGATRGAIRFTAANGQAIVLRAEPAQEKLPRVPGPDAKRLAE